MSTHSITSACVRPSQRICTRRRLFLLGTSLVIVVAVLSCPFTESAVSETHSGRLGIAGQLLARIAFAKSTPLRTDRSVWHTQGSRIVSSTGAPIRITGVNWSGFETTNMVPGGLKLADYRNILRGVHAAGYNTVRIPFSNQMVESPIVPENIAFKDAAGHPINSDLEGLDAMSILDRIIAAAADSGLKVILDNHRSEAGSSAEANGLWYTAQYPESAWITDWTSLATRYRGNSTVIGFDLRNEPHNATHGGSCWSCGGSTDWHLAAQRAGNAILRNNPSLLIFVEGTDTVGLESDFWGGNLAGVRTAPVHLSVPGRLVYSAHVYGPAEYPQSWFNVATTPESLAAFYHRHWGYISENGIAPVWIGEFGVPNNDVDVASTEPGSEGQWFQALVAYLDNHPSIGWTYWGINGEDRYGLLDAAYSANPANTLKAEALASIRQARSSSFQTATILRPPQSSVTYRPSSAAIGTSTAPPTAFAASSNRAAAITNPGSAASARSTARALSPGESAVESSVAREVRLATARALRSTGGQAE